MPSFCYRLTQFFNADSTCFCFGFAQRHVFAVGDHLCRDGSEGDGHPHDCIARCASSSQVSSSSKFFQFHSIFDYSSHSLVFSPGLEVDALF
jgi:hypothetical protein